MDMKDMIRKCRKKLDTKAQVVKQVALDHFPLLDPQDRRHARAPMCLR